MPEQIDGDSYAHFWVFVGGCCMCCLGVLIFFPLALFPLLFPLDRELVYLAPDGSFWDADGEQVY